MRSWNFNVNTITVKQYSMGSVEFTCSKFTTIYCIVTSEPVQGSSALLYTLKTNSSWRRIASVLKPPSQMLGLELGLEGLDFCGGRWGRLWRSCFRGSDGGCSRGGGAVVSNRVGWGFLSGGPGIIKRTDLPSFDLSACVIQLLTWCWPCVSFNNRILFIIQPYVSFDFFW